LNSARRYVWNHRWSAVFFTNTTAKKLYLPEYAAELDTLLKKGYPAPPAASLATDSNRKATRLQYVPPMHPRATQARVVAEAGPLRVVG